MMGSVGSKICASRCCLSVLLIAKLEEEPALLLQGCYCFMDDLCHFSSKLLEDWVFICTGTTKEMTAGCCCKGIWSLLAHISVTLSFYVQSEVTDKIRTHHILAV